jgi:predicted enzyme related to lactoylglutathione lyase
MSDEIRFLNSRPNFEVADLDRAIAFYRDVVGLELTVRADEFSLAVMGHDDATQIALMRVDAPKPRSCYVNVLGVDAAHERCSKARAEAITNPLTTWPWGMKDFVLTDPDGNWLAIGERVTPLQHG